MQSPFGNRLIDTRTTPHLLLVSRRIHLLYSHVEVQTQTGKGIKRIMKVLSLERPDLRKRQNEPACMAGTNYTGQLQSSNPDIPAMTVHGSRLSLKCLINSMSANHRKAKAPDCISEGFRAYKGLAPEVRVELTRVAPLVFESGVTRHCSHTSRASARISIFTYWRKSPRLVKHR